MKSRVHLYTLAVALLLTSSLWAQIDLTFSGGIRYRHEGYKLRFSSGSGVTDYEQLRSRIAVDAVVDSVARVFVQLQDSRTMGGTDLNGRTVSGTLLPKNNVDLHQAFVELPHLGGTQLYLKAGRFEVSLGNERLFGAEDFHYVGRAWEGAEIGVRQDSLILSLSRLRLSEQFVYACCAVDADLWLATVAPSRELQGFAAYEYQVGQVVEQVDRLRRFTIGVYGRGRQSRVYAETNVAMQFGHQPGYDAGYFEENIAAYLFSLEVGYAFRQDTSSIVGVGVDWTSGDDATTSRTYEAFETEYNSARDFRGRMGYFTYDYWLYRYGLLDLYAKCAASLSPKIDGSLSVHRFSTDKKVPVGSGPESWSEVGWEVDGELAAHLSLRVYLQFEGGLFIPTEEFAGVASPSSGWWLAGSVGADF